MSNSYCAYCGKKLISEDDRFCPRCGKPVNPADSVNPIKPTSPAPCIPTVTPAQASQATHASHASQATQATQGENPENAAVRVASAPAKTERSKSAKFFLALLECACFFCVYVAITFAVQFVYGTVISAKMIGEGAFDYAKYYAQISEYICEINTLASVLILLAFFLIFKIRKKRFSREISVKRVPFWSFTGFFAMGIAGQASVSLLLTILYALVPSLYKFTASDTINDLYAKSNPISIVIFVGIITPILEEVLFRGIIYTRLRRVLPVKAAIILSAVAFGAAHGNLEQFLYATALGIVLAAAFERHNSVWASVSVHMAFNLGSFFVVLVPEQPAYFVCTAIVCTGLFMILAAYLLMTENIPIKAVKNND